MTAPAGDEVDGVALGGREQEVRRAVAVDVADADGVEAEVLARRRRGDGPQRLARGAAEDVHAARLRRARRIGADGEVDAAVAVDVAGLPPWSAAVPRPSRPG